MNRFLTLFLLFTVCFSTQAQFIDKNDPSVKTGSFEIEYTPVKISNLPQGLMFIDGTKVREIMLSAGASSSEVNSLIGIIVPDDVTSFQDIEKGWFLYGEYSGHVFDTDCNDIDYDEYLETINDGFDDKSYQAIWLGDPSYDSTKHQLVLPLGYMTEEGVIPYFKHAVLGNEYNVLISQIGEEADLKWLKDNNEAVLNSIDFLAGDRYEDFSSDYNNIGAYSLNQYLGTGKNEIPQAVIDKVSPADSTIDEEPERVAPITRFKDGLLKYCILAACIVVGITIILLILIALTNKRNESEKDIKRLTANVLLRIGVFVMVYLLLLIGGLLLVWVGIELTKWLFTHTKSARIMIAALGGWAIIGAFLYALVRSLFIFHRAPNLGRKKIKPEDAPELFELITDVSNRLGEKMPKKVYLSNEVNACVFYNKGLWSIIFSGRKNLVIGVGVLYGLNKSELKAVLAHEYGHFSQKSMRVGQVTSMSFRIISNIIDAGQNVTLAAVVRPLLNVTYRFVRKGYMTLSRAMEYEADLYSAKLTGNDVAVSALCKLDFLSYQFGQFGKLFYETYEIHNVLPQNMWNVYENFAVSYRPYTGVEFDEKSMLSQPPVMSASAIDINNPWESHPQLLKRIENIREKEYPMSELDCSKASAFLPENIAHDMSEIYYREMGLYNTEKCDDVTFNDYLTTSIDANSFPLYLHPFFDRNICHMDEFDISMKTELTADQLFSDENREFFNKFTQAVSDYQTLVSFKDQNNVKEIKFRGETFNRNNVPIQQLLDELNNLYPTIQILDRAICSYAICHASDKEAVVSAYYDLMYSQSIPEYLNENIEKQRIYVASQVVANSNMNRETFERVRDLLISFQSTLEHYIGSLELHRLYPVIGVDMYQELNRLNETAMFYDDDYLSGAEINYVLSYTDRIRELFANLAYFSKKIIVDSIEGKPLTRYWSGSITESQLNNSNS